MCLTSCRGVVLWQWAMGVWFHSQTGISIPTPISLLFRVHEGSHPCFCRQKLNQERIQVHWLNKPYRCHWERSCSCTWVVIKASLHCHKCSWFQRCGKISSVCTEVWHRSFQTTNLFSLRKCAEGEGMGVVKVTASAVKPSMTAALDQPGSCQSSPPSACGKGTAGFPMCTQRKSLAQLRNHSIICQKCCIFLSRFSQGLQRFFSKMDEAFPSFCFCVSAYFVFCFYPV